MLQNRIRIIAICWIFVFACHSQVQALEIRAFEETPRYALVGLMTGVFSGLHHYGLSKNMNPRHILINSAYGLLSGTLLGVTLDVYEFTSHTDIPGHVPVEIMAIGAVSGAFLGAFWAVVPWALEEGEDENERRRVTDSDFYHGMIGLGIGGLSGVAIGFIVGVAIMPPEQDPTQISTRFGIMPEDNFLDITSQTPAPQLCYRLVEIKY